MTHTPVAEKSRRRRSGPVPDHPVARGRAGAVRSRAVSASGAGREAAARGCARLRTGRRRGGADRRAAVRPLQCRRLCGALRRSCLGRRSDAGPHGAERRGDRLRHRAGAAGIVGDGDVDRNRRSGAARRGCDRDGRAYPAGGTARDRNPPRRFARDNSSPMPAPTSPAAKRCCAPAPSSARARSACWRPAASRR